MLSMMLLLLFPVILLGIVYLFLLLLTYFDMPVYDADGNAYYSVNWAIVNSYFIRALPYVIFGVGVWFLIAYLSNSAMVRAATGARTLDRRENPRIYNIVENLCMSCGMDMPKINVVDDSMLNAFASGIDKKSYTVTVTTGIMNVLNDDELSGVIGHELTHIRNHDTRLLITSIIFVGILSTATGLIMNTMQNMFWFGSFGGSFRRDNENKSNNGFGLIVVLLIGLLVCTIGYLFTLLTRFAISRKREYMADAGGAELSGNPLALASALRKISSNPGLGQVKRDDVAQLFIIHPKGMSKGFMSFINGLFSTHPDTEKRIEVLEQF